MERTRNICLTALFAALTAVGAFLKLPVGTMAMTLQFFFTAMAGALLGRRWGAASQAAYVAIGLMGAPVFTMGAGVGYVLQPSFGFLLGLIPAAWVVGALTEGRRLTARRTALACAAGLGALYLVGLPYMGAVLNLYMDREMSLWAIVSGGMLVYLPGDALKIAACAALAPAVKGRLPG